MDSEYGVSYISDQSDRIRQQLELEREESEEFREFVTASLDSLDRKLNDIVMILSHLKPAVDKTAGGIDGLIHGIREMNAKKQSVAQV